MRTIYESKRLILQVLDNTAAVPVLNFYSEGRQTFEPVEADKNPNFYTLDYQSACLYAEYSAFMHGTYMRYFWKLKDAPDTIIGTASFSNIQRGVYNSCTIGYKLLPQFWHNGYAIEAISRLIEAIFTDGNLHRIDAYTLPDNFRSMSLLTRLGFEYEGLSRSLVYMRGRYRDHRHYSLIDMRGV